MGSYGHIFREIKVTQASFHVAEMVHEGRACNEEAHNLARSSIYDARGRRVWLLSPSEGVCNSFTPA
jgi:hypothetical protein